MGPTTTTQRTIEFRALGPIEVRIDGSVLDIGGARQRRLLALLLSRADSVVTTDALTEHLWDDDDRPENAEDAIRTYVSRLRRAFTTAGLEGASVLVTRPRGYCLLTDGVDTDTVAFEQAVLLARSALDGGDAGAALTALDDALARWHGRPYHDLVDQPWVEQEVARLEELRRVALEQRADARLALGAHAEAVPELQRLVGDDPLRARPVELLMLALHRSGRQAEALRAAARHRRALGEIGLETADSTNDLEVRIAVADPELAALDGSSDTVRGYRLTDKIGEGAFSIVYRSVQPSLGREVAVKQIRAELADQPDFIRRFETEAQLVASLEHPHIVPLYDYWREPGSAYLVMRWLRRGNVERSLDDGPWSLERTTKLLEQIGSALAAAHRTGVVHRDVKPANIFLDDDGNTYLGDFGIALAAAERADPAAALSLGSPAYASPEQLRRQQVGPAADVHGLAITVFEVLAGRLPFPDAADNAAMLRHQLHDPIPSLSSLRADLPAPVDTVMAIATAKDPAERYQTVDAFVQGFADALTSGAGDRAEVRHMAQRVTAASQQIDNPYRGLQAFDERDADVFRGRERLVGELLDLIAASDASVLPLVGASGSGKSSVVRAGLVPAIRAGRLPGSDAWFVTSMSPGANPFEALETALLRIAVNPPASLLEQLQSDRRGILRGARRIVPGDDATVLLVIDQFEELFTLCGLERRRRFLDALTTAVTEPGSPLRLVLTLRADFYDHPLQYPGFAELIKQHGVTITPLAPDELERAIVEPAAMAGVEFESGLVAEIVADVTSQPGALPLMEYALTELFDRRVADVMTADAYHDLGGLTGALSNRADEIFATCERDEQSAARQLFVRLVTLGQGSEDTRRRVHTTEVGAASPMRSVIDRYGAARLLTFDRDPTSREPTVEIAHEALIREWPRLLGWLDEDRAGLRVHRHLTDAAAAWEAGGRDDGDLYRGARLEGVVEWVAEGRAELNQLETEFVDAGIRLHDDEERAERRRLRRLRALLAATAMVAVLALVAGLIAWTQQRRANDEASAAEAERDAAEAAQRSEEAARLGAEDARVQAEAARTDAVEAQGLAEAANDDALLRERIAQAAAISRDQPSLAMLIARETYERAPGPDTLGALVTTLQRTDGYLGHLPLRESSANDEWVGAIDDETVVIRSPSSIDVYDLTSRELVSSTPSDAYLLSASVGGGRFATVDSVRTIRTIDPGETAPGAPLITGDLAGAALGGAFGVGLGEDGSMIIGVSGGARVVPADPDGEVVQLRGHPYIVLAAALDPTGSVAATQDQFGNITLWDVATSVPRWSWTPGATDRWDPSQEPVEVARGKDGITTLTLGLVDGGPQPADEIPPGLPGVTGELRFSADGSTLYSLIAGLIAFDVESGEQRWRAPSPGGQSQLAERADGTVIYGNQVIDDGEVVGVLPRIDANARVALTPDGSTLIAVEPDGISVWSTDGRQLVAHGVPRLDATIATLDQRGQRIAAFGFGLDRSPRGGSVTDVTTGLSVRPPGGEDWVQYTADGTLMTYSPDRVLTLYDPATLEPLGPPIGSELWGSVEVDPARELAAIGDLFAREVRVYDIDTGALLTTLDTPLRSTVPGGETASPEFSSGVFWMDFSPDGRLLAASNQASVAIWSTADWGEVATVEKPDQDTYTDLAFSPDGRELASISKLGLVAVHDLDTGTTRTMTSGAITVSGVNNVNSIEYSDDGRYVVAAGNGVSVVDVETGRLVGPPYPSSGLTSASIAGDGDSFVTGTEDQLLVWRLEPETWAEVACRAAGRNMTADEWEQYGWPGEPYHATCEQWPAA